MKLYSNQKQTNLKIEEFLGLYNETIFNKNRIGIIIDIIC